MSESMDGETDWKASYFKCLAQLEAANKKLEVAAKAIELLESDGLMFLDVTRIALAKYKELNNET